MKGSVIFSVILYSIYKGNYVLRCYEWINRFQKLLGCSTQESVLLWNTSYELLLNLNSIDWFIFTFNWIIFPNTYFLMGINTFLKT